MRALLELGESRKSWRAHGLAPKLEARGFKASSTREGLVNQGFVTRDCADGSISRTSPQMSQTGVVGKLPTAGPLGAEENKQVLQGSWVASTYWYRQDIRILKFGWVSTCGLPASLADH